MISISVKGKLKLICNISEFQSELRERHLNEK